MSRYRVAHVGLGSRGQTHIEGFLANQDRFELVAFCDLDETRLQQGIERHPFVCAFADAEEMLAQTQPDVFCFVTQPNVRLSLAELGVRHGIKAMAFEKPMATSLKEAWAITDLCRRHEVRAIVSHQQKYLTSMQRLKEMVDRGEIGEVTEIHATTQGWLSQLGTHYMDYVLWVNGGRRGKWVVGHVHGTEKLSDSHPSPDYLMGQVAFENGVRAIIECGYAAPAHMPADKFWFDNRLTVYGTHGYAWADTDATWSAFSSGSRGELVRGQGEPWRVQEKQRLQVLYLAALADWLDDEEQVHPCNIDLAYHGYEILEGMCLSALDNRRVDLPLANPERSADILERMRGQLPGQLPGETPGL